MRSFGDDVLVLRQQRSTTPIEITGEDGGFEAEEPPPYYSSESACSGTIVDTVLTALSGTMNIQLETVLREVTVGVDFVVTGDEVVVANAGASDGGPGLLRYGPLSDFSWIDGCRSPNQTHVLATDGRASAVAVDVDGAVVVQSAAPLSIVRAETDGAVLSVPADETTDVVRLFHADAGVGVACASCHPEGLDDGHVWTFVVDPTEPLLRRTMPLAGGILQREPYHWDAALESPDALMADTFVSRMGGGPIDAETTTALFDWLDGLRHPRAHPAAPESTIAIGETAFATAACATCHSGPVFTNNTVTSIGRPAESVKVPSLLGVGVRNDLLHDGCADDLHDRFEPWECDSGSSNHGDLTSLTAEEIAALEAYVRTL